MIAVQQIPHDALENRLDEVAALRINVFRDWPYLYDGDEAYERQYLQSYERTTRAIVVGAFDGDWLVGASTGAPLSEHADDFAAAFCDTDVDIDRTFYFAESVLLPRYRGQGVGHRFFYRREDFARENGFTNICFCAVVRGDGHPEQPKTYTPLDPFWEKRGYAPLDGVIAKFAWKDVDQPYQTKKPLQFWMRNL
jgi:GNAT superfamily N-acetyltransferase